MNWQDWEQKISMGWINVLEIFTLCNTEILCPSLPSKAVLSKNALLSHLVVTRFSLATPFPFYLTSQCLPLRCMNPRVKRYSTISIKTQTKEQHDVINTTTKMKALKYITNRWNVLLWVRGWNIRLYLKPSAVDFTYLFISDFNNWKKKDVFDLWYDYSPFEAYFFCLIRM